MLVTGIQEVPQHNHGHWLVFRIQTSKGIGLENVHAYCNKRMVDMSVL